MSDQTGMMPYRRVEVAAWIIRQAFEHLRDTNERYVALMFVGDGTETTCVGINTRRMITDQRSTDELGLDTPDPVPEEHATPVAAEWTMETLTDDAVLAVAMEHGPVTTRFVGDMLGIPSEVINLRQKVARILQRLVKQKKLRQTGTGRFPEYQASKPPRMSVRTPQSRADITDERIIAMMQKVGAPVSSKSLGDMLDIPRGAASLRQKITTVIRLLVENGSIRHVAGLGSKRTYELTKSVRAAE